MSDPKELAVRLRLVVADPESERAADEAAALLEQQAAELEGLRAERDVLKADAERYRWLLGRACKDGALLVIDVAVIDDLAIGDFAEFIDTTIDSARAGGSK